MAKGGCVDGQLVTTLYGSPVPFVGLYIAAATLVCFFSITFDLVYGLLIQKKPFVPCKLFPMNSFTMMVLAVATKIPVDLTTSMPRAEDQLSKLTGTALLCTSVGFYMPSLGTMSTSERYGNLAALSVMVITMVVNVCIQMDTGVIFAFTIEHIIIMVCILVLLLLMWSSAIAFRGQTERWGPYFRPMMSSARENVRDLQGLRKLLVKLHLLNYTGNPQTLLCETSHHHAFGLLCALSSAVVFQAILRSFALKNMRLSCSGTGVSDYKWSIPIVIVAQFLTIVVGTISIIYRWLSFLCHSNWNDLCAHKYIISFYPERELEYLKSKTFSFRFLSKNLSNNIFIVAKDLIMDVLIHTQTALYTCSNFLGIPIYAVKTFIEFIIPFDSLFHEKTEDVDEMFTSIPDLEHFVCSSLDRNPFDKWISKMAMKDIMRWKKTYMRDPPIRLIRLISECPLPSVSNSDCAPLFIRKLEATGKEFVKDVEYEYRVSCVSVLVLSGMLLELMPSSSSRDSIMQSLNESYEVIYYVDRKTIDTPSVDDEIRWTATKEVWAQWENLNHWFWTNIISCAFKKKSEESKLRILRDCFDAKEKYGNVYRIRNGSSLGRKHRALIETEFLIICKFIQEQKHESVNGVFDFLEKFFAEMICFTLSGLPLAILKEIDGYDLTEIGEGGVKKALKFLYKLELLGDTIEWSWPAKVDPNSGVDEKISNVVDGKVGNTDVSLVDTKAIASCAADVGDTIRVIGSDQLV